MQATLSQPTLEVKSPWIVLSGMIVMIFLCNIEFTAVNVALLAISDELHIDLNHVQWMLSVYVLSWGAFVVPAGRLSDLYGARRMLLLGISLFLVSSIGCALASQEWLLILSRLAQGAGGALFVPPLYALIYEAFPDNKRGLAIGMLGIGAGVGLVAGPNFGGTMVEFFSWRMIFFVNVPICLLAIAIILFSVPKDEKKVQLDKLDFVASGLLSAGLMTLIFAVNQVEVWGFSSPKLWTAVGVSFALLSAFFIRDKKSEDPLIPISVFGSKTFVTACYSFLVFEFSFSAVLVIIGLYLQNTLTLTPFDTGMEFLALTLVFGALSPLGGRIADKFGERLPILLGFMFATLGLVVLTQIGSGINVLWICRVGLLLTGLGLALSFPSLNSLMLKVVDPNAVGSATGVFTMAACLGCSLGVVVSTSLMVIVGEFLLQRSLVGAGLEVSPESLDQLNTLFQKTQITAGDLSAYSETISTVFSQTYVGAMATVLALTAGLLGLAFALSYRNIQLPKNNN